MLVVVAFELLRVVKIVSVIIVIQIKVLVVSPGNKLSKEDLTLSILVGFSPLAFSLTHVDAPLFEDWCGSKELFFVHSLVFASVYLVKSNKEFIILAEILKHVSELGTLSDVVVSN